MNLQSMRLNAPDTKLSDENEVRKTKINVQYLKIGTG